MIKPIGRQISLADDEFIVSKTNIKGQIIYANRVFMRIAGYSESELRGKPHNILRHPDMPRGTFHMLWDTLKQRKEFFAFVKNLCRDGSYYWVFANITPDYDMDDQLIGYYSVRRKPSEEAINTVIPIYKEMLKIEAQTTAASAPKASSDFLLEKVDKLGLSYNEFMFDLSAAVSKPI